LTTFVSSSAKRPVPPHTILFTIRRKRHKTEANRILRAPRSQPVCSQLLLRLSGHSYPESGHMIDIASSPSMCLNNTEGTSSCHRLPSIFHIHMTVDLRWRAYVARADDHYYHRIFSRAERHRALVVCQILLSDLFATLMLRTTDARQAARDTINANRNVPYFAGAFCRWMTHVNKTIVMMGVKHRKFRWICSKS